MESFAPFARPLYVMAKPAGPRCNLSCAYCYYSGKEDFVDPTGDRLMDDGLLELFVRQYLEAQTQPATLFTWHGGEPLLRPISFYRRALRLQRLYARGRHVDNCIQTNATLLNEEWCRFLRDNGFLVGVSLDGPEDMHNAGRGNTFARVMRGVEMLNKFGVEWNAMAVVSYHNVGRPLEFYRFFRSIDCQYLQFTPVVERVACDDGRRLLAPDEPGGRLTAQSIEAKEWGEFLCAVFSEWLTADVGSLFVQLFDATLANWVGAPPGICSLAPTCGQAGAMEHNGDLFSCDHYVFPQYRLGNIRQNTITEMMRGERQAAFGQAKRDALPRQCRECRWLFACNGECPKNRIALDRYGSPGLNHLCAGYRQFFAHAAPAMDYMANELANNRPPSNVMTAAEITARPPR